MFVCIALYLGSGHNPKYTLSHIGDRRIEVLRFDNVSSVSCYTCNNINLMILIRMLRLTDNTTEIILEHIPEFHHLSTDE